MSFGEQGDDENRSWQETDYPMINYKKKEVRTVQFDKQNLFDAHCEK